MNRHDRRVSGSIQIASEAVEEPSSEVVGGEPESGRPPRQAQILAVLAIVVAGTCGSLIGYAFADLQCTGDCTVINGASSLVGGVTASSGTAVVAVLALRAMGEWQTIRATGREHGTRRDAARRRSSGRGT